MKYGVSRVRLACIVSSLVLTSMIFCLVVLKYYIDIALLGGEGIVLSEPFMRIANVLLVIALVLLLAKDFVPKNSIYREVVVTVLIVVASAYAFLWSLVDVSRLKPGSFIYIPPAFIITKCYLILCEGFSTLTISVPLGVTTLIFIYGLYAVVKTLRASRVKDVGEIVNGSNA